MTETSEIEIRNGSLVFKAPSVKNDYNGRYQCEVKNEEGILLSRVARLTYADFNPVISPNQVPIIAVEYTWVVINCPLKEFSYPDISYTWMKKTIQNFEFVDPNSMDTFVSLDGYLYISEVNMVHAGNYSCNIMFRTIEGNGIYLGDANSSAEMSKERPLKVNREEVDEIPFDIVQGFPKVFPIQPKLKQTVDFECVAHGRLPIEYSWKHNDEDIDVNNTQFKDRVQFSDGNRRMKISHLRLMDEGNYTCIATSGVNETSKYMTLEVKGVPVFSVKPSDHTGYTNSFVKLNCLVYDPASPTTHWLKNGKPLKNISDQIYVGSESLILFSPTIGRDEGIYQCSATNIFGTVYSSAAVIVKEPNPTSGSQFLHSRNILLPIVLLLVLLYLQWS
ncbi:hypothetical protein LOTGIDRAFT_164026 [Lottia gigantea]|uniref:Ig-like domain-containing protein n=1 Tax=Lottia gigantea TaxID=225164 RepID=V4BNK5_LOTGI|nr:hypothetical protein LOTGIDRAFT_164026 [Lottia gigantea]ESO90444.1 hypothetical protein LOTGIDRAFT_164026 [Lottia gigantea]